MAWEYWRAGGWTMLPLAACAYLIWFRCFVLWRFLRTSLAAPVGFADAVAVRLGTSAQRPAELARWAAAQSGLLPRLVSRALADVDRGVALPVALAQSREVELAIFQRAFYFLGALVTAAPLLGLLGTVLGMMDTFRAVSQEAAGTQVLLGGGISKALITTQAGLVIALPGTFGLAYLYRLYQRLTHDVRHLETRLARTPCGGNVRDGQREPRTA